MVKVGCHGKDCEWCVHTKPKGGLPSHGNNGQSQKKTQKVFGDAQWVYLTSSGSKRLNIYTRYMANCDKLCLFGT